MKKRYQVFVSSTFVDLKDERAKVMQSLMQMKCFPSGMEMFPALDEDQWEYIKKAIDECDYYILVIAGRYGSVDGDNISYTEKEYDYAVKMRKPVLALLHKEPDQLAAGKTDKNDERREALNAFRSKVQTGRLTKYWNNSDDLSAQVVLGMMSTIERFPSSGWVKGDTLPDDSTLEDIIRVGRENEALRYQVEVLENKLKNLKNDDVTQGSNIAGLSKNVELSVTLFNEKKTVSTSWGELFVVVSSQLERGARAYDLKSELGKLLSTKLSGQSYSNYQISDSSFDKVMIQFRALNLIDLSDDGFGGDFDYHLTEHGKTVMLSELAVKVDD